MISITSSWLGEATVDGVHAEIPIKVTWNNDDPLILSCEFDGVDWEIGRDLIKEAALSTPLEVGVGDVKASIRNESLNLTLSTSLGIAEIWMPWWRMKNFLSKAYNIIPQGEEKLDVDGAITKLLEGA